MVTTFAVIELKADLTTGVRFGWRQAIEKENFNEDQLPGPLDRSLPALRTHLRKGVARQDLREGVRGARPRPGEARRLRRHRVLHHALHRRRRKGPSHEGHRQHRARHGAELGPRTAPGLQGHGQHDVLLPEVQVREARAEAHAQARRFRTRQACSRLDPDR